MLKKRDVNGHECNVLFNLITHPDVFPFVRQKATSYEEFLFSTKQIIEAEERGELISRTILDEWENPIGTINLYDIHNQSGFLGTWIGKPYHGKGYNLSAKTDFLKELFFEQHISTVYMRIKKHNFRSKKAAEKLPYSVFANDSRPHIFKQLNPLDYMYDLYEIPKDLFTMDYMRRSTVNVNEELQQLNA